MAATSNPAARAARTAPTPTRIVLFGAARREIPLQEMAVLEANFRRNPLSCLNELRLTSSLNEAQDNLP